MREQVVAALDDAVRTGARCKPACDLVGISTRTYARWKQQSVDLRTQREFLPPNKLPEQDRRKILKLANQPEFQDLPPSQIVPRLADQGTFIASESTFYRVLKEHQMLAHRHASRPPKSKAPESITATGPNQVWTWDITYLPSDIRGKFYYLYMVSDLFSRKIIGWEVHEEESAKNAAHLISRAFLKEQIGTKPLILHSDNGGPMRGAAMVSTLQKLGVIPSFSRPSVSNDNAYAEALFKTLKYRPNYPKGPFKDLASARSWLKDFTHWYNFEHRHGGIKFVTPHQRHTGIDVKLLAERQQLYEAAKAANPSRWSGTTRNWSYTDKVHLNQKPSTLRSKVEVPDKKAAS